MNKNLQNKRTVAKKSLALYYKLTVLGVGAQEVLRFFRSPVEYIYFTYVWKSRDYTSLQPIGDLSFHFLAVAASAIEDFLRSMIDNNKNKRPTASNS